MNSHKPQAIQESILGLLQERQQNILSHLPAFAKITILLSVLGFAGTIFVGTITSAISGGPALSQFFPFPSDLGSTIALLLTLFSNVVMWVFVVWSLSFVPFIAYQAHNSSQTLKTNVVVKPFRWVQLYASTFLPMMIFAVAWHSILPSGNDSDPLIRHTTNIVIQITSPAEAAVVILGTIIVVIMLWVINNFIPSNFSALRLSLISSMLYASLFLAYGRGYGAASHAVVFGILTYLTLGANQIEEVGRRIAVYDIEPNTAQKLEEIVRRDQERRSIQDEALIKQEEHEAQKAMHRIERTIAQAKSEEALNEQLSKIHKEKIELNRQMVETQLNLLRQRIQIMHGAFRVVSEEFTHKARAEMDEKIKWLEANAKYFSPEELIEQMRKLRQEMDASIQGIPESLQELYQELQKTASQLEVQTLRLTEGYTGLEDKETRLSQNDEQIKSLIEKFQAFVNEKQINHPNGPTIKSLIETVQNLMANSPQINYKDKFDATGHLALIAGELTKTPNLQNQAKLVDNWKKVMIVAKDIRGITGIVVTLGEILGLSSPDK